MYTHPPLDQVLNTCINLKFACVTEAEDCSTHVPPDNQECKESTTTVAAMADSQLHHSVGVSHAAQSTKMKQAESLPHIEPTKTVAVEKTYVASKEFNALMKEVANHYHCLR